MQPTPSLRDITSTARHIWRFQQLFSRKMEGNVATSIPTTLRALMESCDIVPRQWQTPQMSSRPGRSHMRLGSDKQQSNKFIASLPPDAGA